MCGIGISESGVDVSIDIWSGFTGSGVYVRKSFSRSGVDVSIGFSRSGVDM